MLGIDVTLHRSPNARGVVAFTASDGASNNPPNPRPRYRHLELRPLACTAAPAAAFKTRGNAGIHTCRWSALPIDAAATGSWRPAARSAGEWPCERSRRTESTRCHYRVRASALLCTGAYLVVADRVDHAHDRCLQGIIVHSPSTSSRARGMWRMNCLL